MEILTDIEHPLLVEIECAKYLLIAEIAPVIGTVLEVRIVGASALGKPRNVIGIANALPILPPPDADVYSFVFRNFVSYSVTEEMFSQGADNQVSKGGRIRIYTKSCFLDFVSNTTWASDEYPGKLVHYQFNTLDHTVDVVTANQPEIVVTKS